MTDTSPYAPSEGGVTEGPPPLWYPSQDRIARSALTAFSAFVKGRFPEIDITTYEALHHWSITATDDFWRCIWDYCEVIASEPSGVVVQHANKMPGALWFPDARLNFAENLLRRRGDGTALVSLLENGSRKETSFDGLYTQVAAIAAALKCAVSSQVIGWQVSCPMSLKPSSLCWQRRAWALSGRLALLTLAFTE